jgi:small subunit ribosomal protein S29
MANLLSQIAKANASVLDNLKVTKEHNLPVPVPTNTSLTRLCELGGRDGRDADFAWPIFKAFWSEITAPGMPPIMMCMDSVSFIMQNSLYRTQDFNVIHSHDLAIVRHYVDLLSGTTSLPNGGAVLAATNRSHAPLSKSLDLALKQAEDRYKIANHRAPPSGLLGETGKHAQSGSGFKSPSPTLSAIEQEAERRAEGFPGAITQRDPYEKNYDARTDEVLKNIEVMKIGGISKAEARGLMEYWAKSGVLRTTVNEQAVAEKWALAGNGIVGEIQRGALWMRI